ncbi:centriole, cilia and spindle-associated protein isoform X2 [Clinocottus analis]|uniref:centriole, cilia and spindle-associated protein isoform X2 n=1 Tax=Clinocottus analis TaxID=304258 RepID=UPI0035C1E692
MSSGEDQTGPVTRTMVTKKIRTEYMKKFRDPKWETFSKCYEDSLRYRLSRRVMEHSHRPWFWEGRAGAAESSGPSTPRPSRSKVAPLTLMPPPPPAEVKRRPSPECSSPHEERRSGDAAMDAAAAAAAVTVNGVSPSDDTETDGGPVDSVSSDGEPVNPAPKRRPRRRRAARPEPGRRDDEPAVAATAVTVPAVAPAVRKTPRAKSQPPISTKEKENRRPSSRMDWSERREQRTTSSSSTSDVLQPRRRSLERRRARSADLEKTTRRLTVDERWTTEYMRCFSARMR